MSKHKISNSLATAAMQASQNIYRYETVERFVLNRVVEASQHNMPVDDYIIKAAKSILINRTTHH